MSESDRLRTRLREADALADDGPPQAVSLALTRYRRALDAALDAALARLEATDGA